MKLKILLVPTLGATLSACRTAPVVASRDSSNLDCDETTAHSNYHNWVQRLGEIIRAQLTLL